MQSLVLVLHRRRTSRRLVPAHDGAVLDAAHALAPPDGTIKFYRGEPTIDIDNLVWGMRHLRRRGFAGWFTIFSNGVLAERVIAALDAAAFAFLISWSQYPLTLLLRGAAGRHAGACCGHILVIP
jgi:hypothetical protein